MFPVSDGTNKLQASTVSVWGGKYLVCHVLAASLSVLGGNVFRCWPSYDQCLAVTPLVSGGYANIYLSVAWCSCPWVLPRHFHHSCTWCVSRSPSRYGYDVNDLRAVTVPIFQRFEGHRYELFLF